MKKTSTCSKQDSELHPKLYLTSAALKTLISLQLTHLKCCYVMFLYCDFLGCDNIIYIPNVEAVGFCETFVTTYMTAQNLCSEGHSLNCHLSEYLISYFWTCFISHSASSLMRIWSHRYLTKNKYSPRFVMFQIPYVIL